MTSNTEPSGKCSASSVYDGIKYPYYAFDGDISDDEKVWCASKDDVSPYLQYEFDTVVNIKKIVLHISRASNISISASVDGTDESWETLCTKSITSSSTWNDFKKVDMISINNRYYKYFRMNLLERYNGMDSNVQIFQLYGRK